MAGDKAGAKKLMAEANAEYKKGNYSAALEQYDKERSGLRPSSWVKDWTLFHESYFCKTSTNVETRALTGRRA